MNSLGAGRGAQAVGQHVLPRSLCPQECWVKRGVGVRAPGRPVLHGGTRPPCPLHPTLSSRSQLQRHPRPAGAHTLPLCTPGPRHVWTSGSQAEPSGQSGGQAASPRPVGHPRGSGAIAVFPGARAPPAWARQAWGGDCSPEKEILNEKLTQGWKFTGFQVVLTFHAPAAVSLENKHCRVETMPPVSPAAAGHKGGCPPSSPRALVEAGPEKPEGPGPSARLQTRPRRAPPAPAWRLQPRLPPPGPAPARRLLRQRVAKGDVKTAGLGACAGQPLGRNGFRGVCGPWQPAERRSRAQPRP